MAINLEQFNSLPQWARDIMNRYNLVARCTNAICTGAVLNLWNPGDITAKELTTLLGCPAFRRIQPDNRHLVLEFVASPARAVQRDEERAQAQRQLRRREALAAHLAEIRAELESQNS